jgi:hypothetical protein
MELREPKRIFLWLNMHGSMSDDGINPDVPIESQLRDLEVPETIPFVDYVQIGVYGCLSFGLSFDNKDAQAWAKQLIRQTPKTSYSAEKDAKSFRDLVVGHIDTNRRPRNNRNDIRIDQCGSSMTKEYLKSQHNVYRHCVLRNPDKYTRQFIYVKGRKTPATSSRGTTTMFCPDKNLTLDGRDPNKRICVMFADDTTLPIATIHGIPVLDHANMRTYDGSPAFTKVTLKEKRKVFSNYDIRLSDLIKALHSYGYTHIHMFDESCNTAVTLNGKGEISNHRNYKLWLAQQGQHVERNIRQSAALKPRNINLEREKKPRKKLTPHGNAMVVNTSSMTRKRARKTPSPPQNMQFELGPSTTRTRKTPSPPQNMQFELGSGTPRARNTPSSSNAPGMQLGVGFPLRPPPLPPVSHITRPLEESQSKFVVPSVPSVPFSYQPPVVPQQYMYYHPTPQQHHQPQQTARLPPMHHGFVVPSISM